MANGMRGLASGLGSLGAAYETGRQSRFSGEAHRSDMDTANLERILAQAKEARAAEMHPLDVQGKVLGNEGASLGNQQTAQTMGLNANKELRNQEDHEVKQQQEIIQQYGVLSSELEALPVGIRMDYLNKRLGNSPAGRNQIRAFQEGMKQGDISPANLPQILKAINEHAIKRSPAYMQSENTAKIGADSRAEVAGIRAASAIESAQTRAASSIAAAETRAAASAALQEEKFRLREKEREMDLNRQLVLLEERQKGAEKLQELRSAVSGKGSKNPKDFQSLSTALLQQSLLLKDSDPKQAAKLREEANVVFDYAATLKAAGAKQTDTVLTTGDDGKAGLGQQGRIPSAPGTTPKPSGGASGSWEGWSIKKK